jgi:predicted transposase YbfD/YdcC
MLWCSANWPPRPRAIPKNFGTAIPKLLELLDLRGAIISPDVHRGQRQMTDGLIQKQRRYFASILKGTDAKTFSRLIRSHWQIENSLHWSLDVSFSEDASRIRNGYGAENFSRLRRIALNLLKRETTEKVGIKAKRLRAGWDEDYMLKVLTS